MLFTILIYFELVYITIKLLNSYLEVVCLMYVKICDSIMNYQEMCNLPHILSLCM